MNESQRDARYRTVYSRNQRRLDPATVVAVSLVIVALLVFFVLLMAM